MQHGRRKGSQAVVKNLKGHVTLVERGSKLSAQSNDIIQK